MEYLQYLWKIMYQLNLIKGFKPCYKWNTFNTSIEEPQPDGSVVLNLVINGIPSIQKEWYLVNGILKSFKPCYKWNTFNTYIDFDTYDEVLDVLNLVINGIPSIL